MGSTKDLDGRGLTRREILSRAAALGGAAAGSPVLLATGFSGSVLASEPKKLGPTYVAGTLVALTQEDMRLHVPGYLPEIVTVRIPDGIQICRQSCDRDKTALRIADRIDASTHIDRAGRRVAEWIVANGIAAWGLVEQLQDDWVELGPMPGMRSFARRVLLGPESRVVTERGEARGTARALRRGDAVHYTATAAEPSYRVGLCWALTIHRTSQGNYR